MGASEGRRECAKRGSEASIKRRLWQRTRHEALQRLLDGERGAWQRPILRRLGRGWGSHRRRAVGGEGEDSIYDSFLIKVSSNKDKSLLLLSAEIRFQDTALTRKAPKDIFIPALDLSITFKLKSVTRPTCYS